MLSMLKSGGKLLFNAPNLDACSRRGQLWVDSAPPPDVVTLYKPGFWTKWFSDCAAVYEKVEYSDAAAGFPVLIKNVLGLKWPKPHPVPLLGSGPANGIGIATRVARKLDLVLQRAARFSRLAKLAPKQPAEFGLFVTMQKY
jgi:hypothetical protein